MTARADRTEMHWGGATDVGRVRTNNQDQFLARPDLDLWAVADGMGGHSGGEVASQIACDTLGRSFADRTVDGLIDAVEQANTAVFRAGADNPELTGMGTTVVALAAVEHEGDEVVAIANVGDSRCYRYAEGELDQVTTDHSLVADLVRDGSLSPEEAAVHPQRNIVTRVLGVYDTVPVDVFAVDPHGGDRYVLCSDGLFNEVPEPAIAAVLRRQRDPAVAANELVRLAIEGGGRDNVTVVVVDVVDDGGRAAAASAALAADGAPGPGSATRPTPSPAYAGDEADRWRSHRTRRATDTAEIDPVADLGDGADPAPVDDDEPTAGRRRAGRPRRRLTWRVALFTLLILALAGGVVATIQWYGSSAYFVGFEDDRVAIFKGRPGGVLWIEPELVDVTTLERDRVPVSRRSDIDAGIEQTSLTDARRYVANVSEQADELHPTTTSTTTTSTTTAPTTTTTRPTTTTASP
ncbi:MAG TPA: Stp1/IreP family PP2C-type Ser/Thr phosphatase [Acidimicrobiales bacterium]